MKNKNKTKQTNKQKKKNKTKPEKQQQHLLVLFKTSEQSYPFAISLSGYSKNRIQWRSQGLTASVRFWPKIMLQEQLLQEQLPQKQLLLEHE